ncbi:MAG: hypothetical protein R6W82_03275, partial [bacterium]
SVRVWSEEVDVGRGERLYLLEVEADFRQTIGDHPGAILEEIEPDGEGGYRKSRSGRCTRHPISGTVIAARAGLPLEVQNIIACHSKEGDGRPKVVETIFIHQADFAAFDPLTMGAAGQLIGGER